MLAALAAAAAQAQVQAKAQASSDPAASGAALRIAKAYISLPDASRRRLQRDSERGQAASGIASEAPSSSAASLQTAASAWCKQAPVYALLDAFVNTVGSAAALNTRMRQLFAEAIAADLRATRMAERDRRQVLARRRRRWRRSDRAELVKEGDKEAEQEEGKQQQLGQASENADPGAKIEEVDDAQAWPWPKQLRLLALMVLKELSRLPGGSAPLASAEGLAMLLEQLTLPGEAGAEAVAELELKGQEGGGIAQTPLSSLPSSSSSLSSAPVTAACGEEQAQGEVEEEMLDETQVRGSPSSQLSSASSGGGGGSSSGLARLRTGSQGSDYRQSKGGASSASPPVSSPVKAVAAGTPGRKLGKIAGMWSRGPTSLSGARDKERSHGTGRQRGSDLYQVRRACSSHSNLSSIAGGITPAAAGSGGKSKSGLARRPVSAHGSISSAEGHRAFESILLPPMPVLVPAAFHSASSPLSASASARAVLEAAVPTAAQQRQQQQDRGSPSVKALDSLTWSINDIALRCLNNTLFLHEQSRALFANNDSDNKDDTNVGVGGGAIALELLQLVDGCAGDVPFLAARLIFYCTLFEAPFNKVAVEELGAIDKLTLSMTALLDALEEHLANSSLEEDSPRKRASAEYPKQLNAALGEVLKAFFNISLYYPRFADESARQRDGSAMLGEAFHPVLAKMLGPTIRLVLISPESTPPLATPLTNAIAVLLNFPVKDYRDVWFQVSEETSTGSLPSSMTGLASARRFAVNLFSPKGNRQKSNSNSKQSKSTGTQIPPLLTALVGILDRTTKRYFSAPDVDSALVNKQAAKDSVKVEDLLQPLLLLVRKLAAEDAGARAHLRNILAPPEIDRSIGLDKRTDLTGRLVRFMGSALFPRLMRAAGELFLSLYNGNPQELSSQIGYGPSIGFLLSVNLAGSVPKPPEARSGSAFGQSRPVNPITGSYEPTAAEKARDPINQMTDEEKEAEAEKLFSLFDRMNKTGVVKVENPMQNPKAQSRFQEIQKEEEQKQQEEEEAEEKSALKELERWRAERKKKRC
ncbi:hypothetical protein K437DRAFT_40034 [Tilletiaria anomala UBC 951]|uniref:Uncharacterized protein n=1 Tax=Tilletiaria anomala (strain ATCC 24038 / CBS 436.72 / UBC 951) TaxID=1037660 RepID=A0A066WM72_TILAU|nr:uncharacterized protein K437DRAFT_40034 [Tilletiaria anomala UBC 951]KDN52099.1 hypothetical protein K437DRAFT_40034 [Tilletiaria anomala UBC 951]